MIDVGGWTRGWAGGLLRVLLAVAVVPSGACKPKPPPTLAEQLAEDELLAQMRTRPVPDPSQAKLTVKLRSKPLGIAAPPLGGGLVVDRPGRAYFVILSPVGGPVFTLTSDGAGVAMMNTRDREWVVSEDAALALGSATGDQLVLDDLVALLLGLVPADPKQVRARTETADGVQLVIEAPGGVLLEALIDPILATPRSIRVTDAASKELVLATYEPFQQVGDAWLPSGLVLFVPSVELTIELRYRSWKELDAPPDVFKLEAPPGYAVLSMAEYAEKMAEAARQRAGESPPVEETPAPQ